MPRGVRAFTDAADSHPGTDSAGGSLGSGSGDSGSGGESDDGGGDSGGGGYGAGEPGAGTGAFAGGSGDGAGGKRKRGRPRKAPVELLGEPVNPTLTEKTGRGRKRGPDLGVLVDTTVVGLFGLVAVATGHEHWLKDREEVMQITGPLNAWIDQLPAKTLKKVEKNLAPCLFAVGCAIVIGPDVALEMRLRAEAKRARLAVSQPQTGGSRAPFRFAERPSGAPNGANADARSSGGWASSVPSGPIVGYSPDE